jgi:hypothetical protein
MPQTLLINGEEYSLWKPSLEEKEFHPLVKEQAKYLFGENTIYLAISPKLSSLAHIGAKPDGFLIAPVESRLYVVEIELSTHDPYNHINNQLMRFINSLKNPQTRNALVEILYDEIESDAEKKSYLEKVVKENIHRWLSKLVNNDPRIIVVIEEKTADVEEACQILSMVYDTRILEFKVYKSKDNKSQAYFYDKLPLPDNSKEETKTSEPGEKAKKYRMFYESFLSELKASNPTFTKATQPPEGAWWRFAGGKTGFVLYTLFKKQGGFYVGYWVRGANPQQSKEYYDKLTGQKTEIEMEIGQTLEWELWKQNNFWIGASFPNIRITSGESDLSALRKWAVNLLPKLKSTIIRRVT